MTSMPCSSQLQAADDAAPVTASIAALSSFAEVEVAGAVIVGLRHLLRTRTRSCWSRGCFTAWLISLTVNPGAADGGGFGQLSQYRSGGSRIWF
jgi:hypothetical protein